MDEALLLGLGLGAHGAVGSTYNFAAPLYLQLISAHAAGDVGRARELQERSVLLVDTLARRGYPAAAKAVMQLLGVDCGPVRLPLQQLGNGEADEVRADLAEIGFFGWIERRSA